MIYDKSLTGLKFTEFNKYVYCVKPGAYNSAAKGHETYTVCLVPSQSKLIAI